MSYSRSMITALTLAAILSAVMSAAVIDCASDGDDYPHDEDIILNPGIHKDDGKMDVIKKYESLYAETRHLDVSGMDFVIIDPGVPEPFMDDPRLLDDMKDIIGKEKFVPADTFCQDHLQPAEIIDTSVHADTPEGSSVEFLEMILETAQETDEELADELSERIMAEMYLIALSQLSDVANADTTVRGSEKKGSDDSEQDDTEIISPAEEEEDCEEESSEDIPPAPVTSEHIPQEISGKETHRTGDGTYY